MYRGADGNTYFISEDEKREVERTVMQMYTDVILVMGFLFLIVICISCYCYKKKRVTPGFVISLPPAAVTVASPGPNYPAGTPVYPAGSSHPPGPAAYPPGQHPSETAQYPHRKQDGPPPYTPVTQTHL